MFKLSPKWKKIIGYSIASIIILLLAIWGILYWYISANKKSIISKIEQSIGDKIEGKVEIKNIQPDFLKNFPLISFRIDSVSLSDSLYSIYQKKLLSIEHIFVRLDFFSVLKGSPSFSKINIENGSFNIFIDSNGYSNSYLLKTKDSQKPKDNSEQAIQINSFELNNFSVNIDNQPMDKNFAFTLQKLNGSYSQKNHLTQVDFYTETNFDRLGFNLDLGSFLKKATLKAQFKVEYNKDIKTIKVHNTPLNIDGEKIMFSSSILLDKEKDIPFEMTFEAKDINYNTGINWLSENIYKKLSKIKFDKTLNVTAKLHGGFTERNTNPHITLQYDTKNNKVSLFDYSFDKVFFKGRFDNEIDPALARHDSNSLVTLDTLSADYAGLPIRGKKIVLTNLKHPFVNAALAANFDASVLNNIFGTQFNFNKGKASYDLAYKGELFLNTLVADKIYGSVKLNNIDFIYKERNLHFNNGNVVLGFNGSDLNINQFQVTAHNSDLNITGVSKDFLTAFMQLPGKAMMDLKLNSNNIDFGAFETYFVQKRTSQKSINTGNAIKNASNKLEDFLTNSSIAIAMNINKANYKKLKIANLNALMRFREEGINIENLKFNAVDGKIALQAGINQQALNNPFFAKVNIEGVKVDKFLYAFNNFGFKGFSDKNVQGRISIDGNIKGNITDRGVLLENTIDGMLNYQLVNAALIDFGFFDKIKRFFRNRKLENVEVELFKGSLSIQNGTINIPLTHLETSALHLSFSGKYGLTKGRATAIDLRIPLRNPQVDKRRIEQGKKKRKGEGIVLNFKATSGADGKINLGVGKTDNAPADGKPSEEEDE